jgi:hypothetical protein
MGKQIFGLRKISATIKTMKKGDVLWIRGKNELKNQLTYNRLLKIELATDQAALNRLWLVTLFEAFREGKDSGKGRRNFLLTNSIKSHLFNFIATRDAIRTIAAEPIRTVQASAIEEFGVQSNNARKQANEP